MKKFVFALSAALSLGFSGVASADTMLITSSPGGSNTFTASSITFSGVGSNGPNSGLFAGIGACASCVVMTSFSSSTTTPFVVFDVTNGANTGVVTLASDTFTVQDIGGTETLTINGAGSERVTVGGVATTVPISFDLSTQNNVTGPESFSASITTTPLPATWTMLITAFLGMGLLLGYRGTKKQAGATAA